MIADRSWNYGLFDLIILDKSEVSPIIARFNLSIWPSQNYLDIKPFDFSRPNVMYQFVWKVSYQ